MSISHDVTVIIPNYNRVESLFIAIKSILFQSEKVKNIIVIDDFSDSEKFIEIRNEINILEKIDSDISIELIRLKRNSGANVCRNVGISRTITKYIAFLDSDDIWNKNKIKIQMEHIYRAIFQETRPVLSCTGRLRLNEDKKIIAQQFSGRVLSHKKLLSSNYLGTLSSVVVDSWIAKFVGGFDETLPACQDWDFFIKLSKYVKYVGVSEPLCFYVDHNEERITSGNKKRIYGHLKIRSKYLKSNTGDSDFSEFYRNLAEDYSELGNEEYAIKYYTLHLYEKEKNNIFRVLKYPFFYYDAYSNWKKIKSRRYMKYKEKDINFDYNLLVEWMEFIK